MTDPPAPFSFTIDHARKGLIVTKSGYWDMPVFNAFAGTFRDMLRRMKLSGGCDYCLIDASAFMVQSTTVSTALLALVESFDPACPRRMAGISGSQLGKLQARVGGERPARRVFSSRADAEAWLFADPSGAATPAAAG